MTGITLRQIVRGLAGLLMLAAVAQRTRAADPPNVIILFADDQGYQDLGCYGSPHIKTPHIDRLAAEGMRFTDFYSAYCVCSASRASLMTGSYQPRLSMPGVLGPHSKTALHPEEVTIADLLKTKGYATQMIGKWHLGDSPETLPTSQGFDHYFGLPYSNDMARVKDWGNDAPDLDRIWKEKRWDIYENQLYRDTEVIESPVNQQTLTDRYTDEAVRFVTGNKDRPFFLYLAYSMVHVPLFVPDDRYDPDPRQAYRLAMEHVDDSVGRILAALDEYKLAQNTLVVYSSDNGPWLPKQHHAGSAKPLRDGKGTTYDGGMRVPGVMRWPARIPAGATCRRVAGTIDLLPTIAAQAGAQVPADRPIDGRDISALLADPNAPSPHDTEGYFYYRNGTVEAIRQGPWKLRTVKGIELYNLEQDIGESTNLADRHPEQVKFLQQAIETYDADLKAHVRPAWKAPGANPAKPKRQSS
jgi:arylsulfatase A